MIYVEFTNNGSVVNDLRDLQLTKSISDNDLSSSFSAEVSNKDGRNINNYQIGNEVKIFSSTDIIQSSNPTLYFDFNSIGDAFSGANFLTINPKIGSVIGSAFSGLYYDDGKIGSAIHGKTNAYMLINNNLLNLPTKNFAISLWTNNTTNASAEDLFASRTTEDKFAIRLARGSVLQFYDWTGGGTQRILSDTAFQSGVWNFYVYNREDTQSTLFKNGSQVAVTTAISGVLEPTNNDYYFMSSHLKSLFWASGLLDEFRIYNNSLGSNDIFSLFNNYSGTERVRDNDLIFTGILEDTNAQGEGYDDSLSINGRDYTANLMDRTVEPEVYNNLPAGSIVKDIIDKYTEGITLGSVDDGATITRIRFNHVPVYDAIKQLADNSGYSFYITPYKQLFFTETGEVDTGITLNSGNTINAEFEEKRDTVFNQVWVYGDRYLDSFKETKTAGSPVGGSVFTLLYKPHNTQITVSGAVIQPGGVFEMLAGGAGAGSNVKYLVSFEDKQIIFTSGTSQGANIPASGNSVVIQYDRDLPIVKVGDDETSKAKYGTRVKVIQDKNIKDPRTAELILNTELTNSSEPIIEGNLELKDVYNLVPGTNVTANFPEKGIDSQVYTIIESKYDFSKENILTDKVQSVKLNKDLPRLEDAIKDLYLQLKKLSSADLSESDVLTRYQYSTGSLGVTQSGVQVWTQPIGSSFILSHDTGSFVTLSSGVYNSGLVAYFRLNEGFGDTTVDYVSGYKLTKGDNAYWTTGIIGKSVGFIGSTDPQYILTGSQNDSICNVISGKSNWAISVWLNYSSWQSGTNHPSPYIITIDDPTAAGHALVAYKESGIYFITGSKASSTTYIYNGGEIKIGSWCNVLFGQNYALAPGSKSFIYINGSFGFSGGITQIPQRNSGSFYIGGYPGYRAFSGLIDEVRIFRYFPSVAEISAIYNSGIGVQYSSGVGSVYTYTGNGVLGSSTTYGIYQYPPHFLGDFRGGSTLIYSE